MPVLLSHFLLNLRRCAEEQRARTNSAFQVSTAIGSVVVQSSILSEFSPDIAVWGRELLVEGVSVDGGFPNRVAADA